MSRSVGGFSNSGHLSLRAVVQSCLFEANSYLQSCKFARNNDPLGAPSYLHANCAMPDRRECALDRVRGAQMRPMLGGKIKERQQRIAGIKGQGVAATSTASPRMGSPERAQAAPATSSVTGKRSNAKRSAIRMSGALAVCAAVTIFMMPA